MTLTLLPKNKLESAFKKVVSKDDNRPILRAVHFDKDGSLTATNSHVLLRINDFHTLPQNFNLILDTFVESKGGEYPETKRLIPDTFELEPLLDPKEFREVLPALKAMSKDGTVRIQNVLNERILKISSVFSSVKLHYENAPVSDKTIIDVSLNPVYLANMFDFYSWYCPKVDTSLSVSMGYNGSLRPLTFSSLDAIYLITPVRTF